VRPAHLQQRTSGISHGFVPDGRGHGESPVRRDPRQQRAVVTRCVPTDPRRFSGATNGLIFQSRRFREACRDYRLRQEFTTPYMPEQNGLIERFFRSLKEECTWQTNFRSFREAKRAVARWIEWYNTSRPHQALGYLSPREYRAQQLNQVAC
jgi:hypothetical protein